MQLLGVGGVAQKLPKAGGLGPGAAEQVDEGFFIEIHQLAHCHRGSQGADRRRSMEDTVMGAAEEFADANAGLVAGHRGQQQFTAGFAQVLGRCQHGGKHHRGRV
ncbi:hypothetical protein D3C86_1636780 [compost metagenome]